MAINWVEIAIQTALFGGMLGLVGLYVRLRMAPRLLSQAEVWMGGAIGRFMSGLAQQAEEEGGGGGGSLSGSGGFNIGGMKIDANLIQSIAELVKVAQQFGLIKGGGGGENPFL